MHHLRLCEFCPFMFARFSPLAILSWAVGGVVTTTRGFAAVFVMFCLISESAIQRDVGADERKVRQAVQ